jgi:urease accessory protein
MTMTTAPPPIRTTMDIRTVAETAAAAAPMPPGPSAATLLRLMWLASPALPVGGFSYSDGLEAAIDAGLAADEPAADQWLLDQLHLAQARADLPLVAAAFQAWEETDLSRIEALNGWLLATRETSEQRQQAEQMGRSLAGWMRVHAADDQRRTALAALQPAPSWPVAFALAAAVAGATLRDALLAFAFGWAENQVAAAVKAIPLGQTAGQRILSHLADAIPGAVERALQTGDATRQAYTPMLAILSARHETQYSRLFRS